MAKSKVFDIGGTVGGILKIVVLAIIGILVWVMLSSKFLKSKDEKQDEEKFEKKGAFRSLIDFFGGEGTSENLFPTSSEDEQSEKEQRDQAQKEKLEEAQKELEKIEDQISERDRLAKELTDKTIGAQDLNQDQINKLNEDNKRLAEQIVKAKAEQERLAKEAKAKGQAPPPKTPEQEIDRDNDAFKIFRFTKPVTSRTGKTFTDFVIADKDKLSKAELDKLKKDALKQVQDNGFKVTREITTLSGQKKTITEKPIVALSAKTLERAEKDERLRKQLEAIQQRKLGLRKPNEPIRR